MDPSGGPGVRHGRSRRRAMIEVSKDHTGSKGHARSNGHGASKGRAAPKGRAASSKNKMTEKEYLKLMEKLQVELCYLQEWVKQTGARVILVFEGRDAAGKGGIIKAITERVSPRVFRVVALPAPTEREKSQLYMQRYMEHFP